ncbi:MAG: hypothetical protein JOZ17_20145, partial [Acetobacteraceae bacterium]|nr:hypothetical protein [Acetobacteraceae bacterium]
LGIELPEALRLPPRPRRQRQRARKPQGEGAGMGPAGGFARGRAVSRRAGINRRPTKAEIRSWYPGQKRPMPNWSARLDPTDPPVTIWPWPELA